jgi:ankyrin repeat protein
VRFRIRRIWFICLAAIAVAAASSAEDTARVADAAKKRDIATVRSLLNAKADVNTRQLDGTTAIHWAAYWDEAEQADLLIHAGADVNAVNDYGITPLWAACNNGSSRLVDTLLKAGAEPNAALPSGETPLMTASHTGNMDVVKALLAHGAEVNAKEATMGQTALMWAIAERHLDIVKTLVEHGADVRAKSASGFLPFLFAARTSDIETAKFLLAHGADFREAAKDGTTALHVAVVRGHIPFAKFLLDLGADPNNQGPGFSPLHWAAGTWESAFTHDYVFSPEAATSEYEWTVLGGIPTREAKEDLIKTLLAHGADVNLKLTKAPPRYGSSVFPNNYIMGATPFFLAATVADVPTMKLLLANGADPRINANDGTTPLIVAAGMTRTDSETVIPEERHLEAAMLCLHLGQDVNAANNAGNTPLHAAAYAGLDTMVEFLVDHGARINAKNKKGETPTRIADGYEQASMLYTRPSTAALLRKLGGVAQ